MEKKDARKLLFEKNLFSSKDEAEERLSELKLAHGQYVGSYDPYERLRKSLRKLFGSGYPDIFDYGSPSEKTSDE